MAVSVDGYELITVEGDYVNAYLLVWRRYKCPAFGVLERLLDDNPHLAKLHKEGPFLPVGTQVRIPINLQIMKGTPQLQNSVTLYQRLPT
jgi:phage tail protein X